MKPISFILLLSVLPNVLLAQFGVERTQNLGFGFRREMRAERTSSSFEGITHQKYLYYGDQKLCDVGSCSVAPSGKFVIYQDGPTGNLFLFRRADRKIIQLTPTSIGFAESFAWHETEHSVEVHLDGSKLNSFPLP